MRIPFISTKQIHSAAEALLQQHGLWDTFPVDLDLLVEKKMRLSIIPIPDFQQKFGVDGLLAQDLSSISVDEGMMENVLPRYRFTVAHELGHYVLHGNIIREHLVANPDGHLMLWESLSKEEYRHAETQANKFAAGLLMPSAHLQTMFNEVSDSLAKSSFSFDDLEDSSKMKVLRAQAAKIKVSVESLRLRLIGEEFIQEFENPEKRGFSS